MLPRDVDLTLRMDFNKKEELPKLVKLEKTKRDESYKRYNEYEDKSFSSTTSATFSNDNFTPVFESTTTDIISRVRATFDSLYNRTIRVEERICWRKLYRDPNIYGDTFSSYEEAVEQAKNYNFAMGSKLDRLKIHYEKLRNMEDFCAGYYCDCCGKKLNRNNCLSHHDTLCQHCYTMIFERSDRVKL